MRGSEMRMGSIQARSAPAAAIAIALAAIAALALLSSAGGAGQRPPAGRTADGGGDPLRARRLVR